MVKMKWYNNSLCVPQKKKKSHAGFGTAGQKNNDDRIFISLINNLLINLQCYHGATMTHRIKRVFICYFA